MTPIANGSCHHSLPLLLLALLGPPLETIEELQSSEVFQRLSLAAIHENAQLRSEQSQTLIVILGTSTRGLCKRGLGTKSGLSKRSFNLSPAENRWF